MTISCTNLQDKNEETPPKLDSDQDPQKHHTIPADVLPNASEDLFYSLRQSTQKSGPSNILHKLNLTDSLVISHHDLYRILINNEKYFKILVSKGFY